MEVAGGTGSEEAAMEVASHSPSASLEQFAEIIRRHQSGVCAAAYGVTGDRALSEDIAQETFVAAWRSISTLRDPSRLKGWLRGIARNLARKARRKVATIEQFEDLVADDDLARDAIAKDEARVTWAAMRELPAAYREALVLYYWADQSAAQVAESLEITEAAAMQRLSRGRSLLRVEVERLVEGTLRRARPGAVLTAAILAAVAATTAGTAPAAARAEAMPLRGGGAPLRTMWTTALIVVVLGILGTFGASIVGSSGRRPPSDSERPTPAATVTLMGSRDISSAAMPHSWPASSSTGVTRAHDQIIPSDEPDSDGAFWRLLVKDDSEPREWPMDKLRNELSHCFDEEPFDHQWRIEVAVRDGKIARAMVEPFDGTSRRVVVRTQEDAPTTLAPSELIAWLAAGKRATVSPDDPQLADHDKAMQVGEFVGLCAQARLEGKPVSGPDALHHLQVTWSLFTPKKIDHQAYSDLDVATGAFRGPANAPITIVTFLDIASEGASIATLSEVLAKYPRDVRVVIKLCPFKLPGHDLAAEAVYAASAQGALWPMLELVAANGEHLALEDFVGHATTLHLDVSRFRNDLVLHTFHNVVELDQDQMAAMDIHALPSAIVNGKRVHGIMPVGVYISAVEAALHGAVGQQTQ